MNTEHKVYIAMPTYNGENFLAQAITSVLEQTFTDWELHIVDDCSKDKTEEIALSFKHKEIFFHKNSKNLGLVRNFNKSLAYCRSEYISFFHQDDIMKPENLEKKIAVLKKNPNVGFVHSNIELIDEGSNPLGIPWFKNKSYDTIEKGREVFNSLWQQGNRIILPSVLIRSLCIKEWGGFDERLPYTCDYELFMRMAYHYDVAYLHERLIERRLHRNQETKKYCASLKGYQHDRLARTIAIEKSKIELPHNELRKFEKRFIVYYTRYSYYDNNMAECKKFLLFSIKNHPSLYLNISFLILFFKIISGRKGKYLAGKVKNLLYKR
ncbi:MAG: hypothetical protein A2Y00_03575 [Omnitrophica WOR_2 bacterium GWF2_43_52]|nr:MAG: hypothetical protein A2062_03760 [Omnitrophica WOR_2 bacterium GWA2_44_7]OGX22512.1 MAG: hypothetical protein A2Y00_03575 [Omnitrophica WOR_2 bacterium GWF2_43_52]OGX59014.1 MAG: hypothetical protein A2460_03935 [Omnitrophica WOR_2 bacterium RIFOXYC2_FULL_43_9]HAH21483.1 hypothetical protein [Candidatus Omnitrophota bacterium]HBG64601.1 hypothetical protein [Candidatus Omnitrophota bacterium]